MSDCLAPEAPLGRCPEIENRKGGIKLVFDAIYGGVWHTSKCLANQLNLKETYVTACLRNLRRPKFGSWFVETKRVQSTTGLDTFYRLGQRASSVARTA